jgi:hypothetical protein
MGSYRTYHEPTTDIADTAGTAAGTASDTADKSRGRPPGTLAPGYCERTYSRSRTCNAPLQNYY